MNNKAEDFLSLDFEGYNSLWPQMSENNKCETKVDENNYSYFISLDLFLIYVLMYTSK